MSASINTMELDGESDYSSSDEDNSDYELQKAFEEGKLQAGLNYATPVPKTCINNKDGMKAKLTELKIDLKWVERMDSVNDPAPLAPELEAEGIVAEDEISAEDEFNRELRFYRQAQAAVLEGVPKLQKLSVPTRRPDDYFAQMVKSEDHMKKIRQKLLSKKVKMEMSEKAKKLRELRKFGKKVQVEVQQRRQKEKKQMLESVKKYRKGTTDNLDFLNGDVKGDNKATASQQQGRGNKKRDYKNKKFGFGGQKKRKKWNTADSSADQRGFKRSKSGEKGRVMVNMNKKRPGKIRRQKERNKK
ncbi:PREDICTED: probable rRNA-processing protein EBP2 isoform X2 [Priapulus caudatus]|uniref:Probable rRNA-processing protein EBP2 isoform X1 n=1 Tax=Priapulus caudatus TaxID=37621 RepID=A0ABM1EFE8_PRICU|nr:PREDICTED: probable rRNA-processing protein EBP2 isoform X1 [Priapulus caudatus]XP_014670919.1 PREDICTED: probable rRNA-processing protein EBP2 isoform X2 [Priapulus caudatus]